MRGSGAPALQRLTRASVAALDLAPSIGEAAAGAGAADEDELGDELDDEAEEANAGGCGAAVGALGLSRTAFAGGCGAAAGCIAAGGSSSWSSSSLLRRLAAPSTAAARSGRAASICGRAGEKGGEGARRVEGCKGR